jgi:uncharacterized protein
MAEERETLLEFPCRFPIKVLGEAHPEFHAAIEACVQAHVPSEDAVEIAHRPSSAGKYVGVTITFTATSQAELDALYQALGQCARVHMVL